MSKYQSSVSPIKMLNNTKSYQPAKSFQSTKLFQSKPSQQTKLFDNKPYDTPAKYLNQTPGKYKTQKTQTIYEEEYYKQKSQRLQKQNKELKQQIRILQTQNKQLKTQIQIYRETILNNQDKNKSISGGLSQRSRNISPLKSYTIDKKPYIQQPISSQLQTQQIQRLLRQIRILKNNHQMQLQQSKNQQKRLNKQILQLQDKLHNNQISFKQKQSTNQSTVIQKNKSLQNQLKQMRKSIVEYMEQRDQNQHKIQKLNKMLQEKDKLIQELRIKQNYLVQEKRQLEDKVNNKQQISFKDILLNNQSNDNSDGNVQRGSKARQQKYEFGVNSVRRTNNRLKQSNLSIHTFNGARHVPAQQAFELVQCLKSQIHRLQHEIQRQSITHVKQIGNFNYSIQRLHKEMKQKQNDVVNLLTKVKPLMFDRDKLLNKQSKQNVSPKKNKQSKFEQQKDVLGKNAFGLKMLQMFLKKYKMETF